MSRRSSFTRFVFLVAAWLVPVALGAALLSLVPSRIKSWLVPSVLVVTGFLWLRGRWRDRNTRREKERRAIRVDWLHEMSQDVFQGRKRSDNLGYLLRDIETDYEAYAADFPDIDDRLSEAELALKQPTPAEDLWKLNEALRSEESSGDA